MTDRLRNLQIAATATAGNTAYEVVTGSSDLCHNYMNDCSQRPVLQFLWVDHSSLLSACFFNWNAYTTCLSLFRFKRLKRDREKFNFFFFLGVELQDFGSWLWSLLGIDTQLFFPFLFPFLLVISASSNMFFFLFYSSFRDWCNDVWACMHTEESLFFIRVLYNRSKSFHITHYSKVLGTDTWCPNTVMHHAFSKVTLYSEVLSTVTWCPNTIIHHAFSKVHQLNSGLAVPRDNMSVCLHLDRPISAIDGSDFILAE